MRTRERICELLTGLNEDVVGTGTVDCAKKLAARLKNEGEPLTSAVRSFLYWYASERDTWTGDLIREAIDLEEKSW